MIIIMDIGKKILQPKRMKIKYVLGALSTGESGKSGLGLEISS